MSVETILLLSLAATGTIVVVHRIDDRTGIPAAALRLRRLTLDAQRKGLLRLRDVGRLPDAGLRTLERELDHEEGRLPDRT